MVAGSDFPLAAPIHTLITVGNVEEKVLFVMLLEETRSREKMSEDNKKCMWGLTLISAGRMGAQKCSRSADQRGRK